MDTGMIFLEGENNKLMVGLPLKKFKKMSKGRKLKIKLESITYNNIMFVVFPYKKLMELV